MFTQVMPARLSHPRGCRTVQSRVVATALLWKNGIILSREYVVFDSSRKYWTLYVKRKWCLPITIAPPRAVVLTEWKRWVYRAVFRRLHATTFRCYLIHRVVALSPSPRETLNLHALGRMHPRSKINRDVFGHVRFERGLSPSFSPHLSAHNEKTKAMIYAVV